MSRRTSQVVVGFVVIAIAVTAFVKGGEFGAASSATSTTATAGAVVSPAGAAQARRWLAELPVRVPDTGAHYDRDEWGDWITRHGCTSRELVLKRQGHGEVQDTGCASTCPATARPCWTSPYDRLAVRSAGALQIDHLVPVHEAVRSGARDWNRARRVRFYNDLDNLVAVSVHANESKGDGDPGVWRPVAADQCAYGVTTVRIKTRYHLTADHAEHQALAAMLRSCPARHR